MTVKQPCALLSELSDFPTFVEVEKIFIADGDIYFFGNVLETQYFSNHFHGFVVTGKDSQHILTSLHSHHPSPLHVRYCHSICSKIIVPKHNICFK